MVVGVCKLSLMLPESETLKEKRALVRHLKDKVQQKFNCAIAEVGDQELLASAELGFSVVSNDLEFTQSLIRKIQLFIEDLAIVKVVGDEADYIDYGDGGLDSAREHWEPDEDGPPLSAPRTPRPPAPRPDAPQEPVPDWLPRGFLDGPEPDQRGEGEDPPTEDPPTMRHRKETQ